MFVDNPPTIGMTKPPLQLGETGKPLVPKPPLRGESIVDQARGTDWSRDRYAAPISGRWRRPSSAAWTEGAIGAAQFSTALSQTRSISTRVLTSMWSLSGTGLTFTSLAPVPRAVTKPSHSRRVMCCGYFLHQLPLGHRARSALWNVGCARAGLEGSPLMRLCGTATV